MSMIESGVSFRCTMTYECQNLAGYAATNDLYHVTNELFKIGHIVVELFLYSAIYLELKFCSKALVTTLCMTLDK